MLPARYDDDDDGYGCAFTTQEKPLIYIFPNNSKTLLDYVFLNKMVTAI